MKKKKKKKEIASTISNLWLGLQEGFTQVKHFYKKKKKMSNIHWQCWTKGIKFYMFFKSVFKPHFLALYRQMVPEESTNADVMSDCYVFMSTQDCMHILRLPRAGF